MRKRAMQVYHLWTIRRMLNHSIHQFWKCFIVCQRSWSTTADMYRYKLTPGLLSSAANFRNLWPQFWVRWTIWSVSLNTTTKPEKVMVWQNEFPRFCWPLCNWLVTSVIFLLTKGVPPLIKRTLELYRWTGSWQDFLFCTSKPPEHSKMGFSLFFNPPWSLSPAA